MPRTQSSIKGQISNCKNECSLLFRYPTALAALVGMAASLVCGAVADCTKRFKELIRICWVCFALVIIFTRIVSFSANVFLFLSTTDLFIDFPLLESCP